MNRSVLFLSGLSLVGGSLVFACSSSTEDAAVGSDQAEVTSCKPATLHEAGAGPYCPFQGPDASTASACAAAQHCCNPGQGNGDAVCIDNGTACPFPTNGTGPGPAAPDAGADDAGADDAAIVLTPDAGGIDWQCDSPDQCADGEVCCAAVTIAADTYCPGQVKASKSHGTACRSKCLTGEQQTCSAGSQCKNKFCTPYSVSGKQLGYCGFPPDAGTVKKDGGAKKDAAADTSSDDTGEDDSSDDDTTATTDAGKKTAATYRLPASSQGGCASAPGTSPISGGLGALGLGLALAALRRRSRR